jgi:hypothetical protein
VRQSITVAAGGFAVLQDYWRVDGEEPFSAHGVFSVDPGSGEVLHHWFDSRGFTAVEPARGGWDGESLVVVRSSPRGVNRTTFAVDSDLLLHTVEFRAPREDEFGSVARGRYGRAD